MAIALLINKSPQSRLRAEDLAVLKRTYGIFGLKEDSTGLVTAFSVEPKSIPPEVKDKVKSLLEKKNIEPQNFEFALATNFMFSVYREKSGNYYHEYSSYSTMLNNWMRKIFSDIADKLGMQMSKA